MNIFTHAFSKIHARIVSACCQHLVGTPFIKDGREQGIIEAITMSPFDDLNKWIFIHHYSQSRCPSQALEFYQVPFYNVMVISNTRQNNMPLWADLIPYVKNNGIQVELPLPDLIEA